MEVNFNELKAEIEALRRDYESDRPTSDPMLQIGKIITAMRDYKNTVVDAHAPRGFATSADRDQKQRQVLRDHRRADLEDLRNQKEWLMALDCEFVLQGQPWWINEALWESMILGPACRWAKSGFALLYDGEDRIDFKWLDAWNADELEIEQELMAQMMEFLPEGKWPIADLENNLLHWDSREATMTTRDLQILGCLFRAKGRYVDYYDIWNVIGEDKKPAARRAIFSRLNKALVDNGFDDIATAIENDGKNERIRLNYKKLRNSLIERHSPQS